MNESNEDAKGIAQNLGKRYKPQDDGKRCGEEQRHRLGPGVLRKFVFHKKVLRRNPRKCVESGYCPTEAPYPTPKENNATIKNAEFPWLVPRDLFRADSRPIFHRSSIP